MKKIIVILLVVCSTSLWSQEVSSLLGGTRNSSSHSISMGGWGSMLAHGTMIGDELVLFTGGQGAVIINHRFSIGGGGASVQSIDLRFPIEESTSSTSYGGLLLGYHIFPKSAIHFSVYGLFGVLNRSGLDINGMEYDISQGIIIPSINIEFRVTRWMQMSLGVSYMQLMQEEDMFSFSDETMGDYQVSAQVRFGKF